MEDLELELGMTLSYMQSWRVIEYVRLLVMGKPVDHYKLLPGCALPLNVRIHIRGHFWS